MSFTSAAPVQYKIDLQTCEDLKITEAHYGINTVGTATCVNPTKTFQPKGTVRNVNRGKREVMEHRGNLTEYFAKSVLTVR